MTVITPADARKARVCRDGQVAFCAQHGLDYTEFCRAGLDVRLLEHLSDRRLDMVVRAAIAREQQEARDRG